MLPATAGAVRHRGREAGAAHEFGDGNMSTIDFHMDLKRQAHEKGDRESITMSGKFLPCKPTEPA